MRGPPLISSIVIAYDRREFLTEAVNSALRQPPPPGGHEVIVVKNFEDGPIDRFLASHSVDNSVSTRTGIGAKFVEGFDRSHGEVLALLEDDDLWRFGRLQSLASMFSRNPSLTLYHNAFDRFDEEAATQTPSLELPVDRRLRQKVVRAPLPRLPARASKRILASAGLANASCIAVRRQVFESEKGFLSGNRFAPEPAFFAAASRVGGEMFADPTPWTLLRMHAKSATALPRGRPAEQLAVVNQRALATEPELWAAELHAPRGAAQRLLRVYRLSNSLRGMVADMTSRRTNCLRLVPGFLSVISLVTMPGSWMLDEVITMAVFALSPEKGRSRLLKRYR